MRSNQAAVQRRVNGSKANGVPPIPSQQNGYAPYPPPAQQVQSQAGYNAPIPSQQQGYSNSIPQTQTNAMPPKLTAQQQLQFILNSLGDRIAKLEVGHQTITQTLGVSIPLNSAVPVSQTAKNYDQEIGQIQQNMNHLNLSIEILTKNVEQINEQQQQILRQSISSPLAQPQQQNTIAKNIPPHADIIIQNQEQLLTNIDVLSSELDTRTEILTTEINKTKDLVLQLQSTVIHVFQTQFTKSNTPYDQDLENDNSNAPETQSQEEDDDDDEDDENNDLPSLEYIPTDSNYVNIQLDSNASFEYNPEATNNIPTEHHEDDYQDQYEHEDDEI